LIGYVGLARMPIKRVPGTIASPLLYAATPISLAVLPTRVGMIE
jgi:hypothetical protein